MATGYINLGPLGLVCFLNCKTTEPENNSQKDRTFSYYVVGVVMAPGQKQINEVISLCRGNGSTVLLCQHNVFMHLWK